MLEIIFVIFAWFCVIATFLPTLPVHKGIVRAFDFPRVQILFLLIIVNAALICLFSPNYYLIILSVFAAIKIIIEILPYSPLAKVEVIKSDKAPDIKIFIANVLQENNKYAGLIEEINSQDPDIVFLVETNKKWQGFTQEIANQFKYKVELPLENYNGMLLYSKFKLENIQIRYLVLDFIPSITVDICLEDGNKIKFYGVHPRPPRLQNEVIDRDKELLLIAEEISKQDLPTVITGDLNDVGWSPTTKRFLKESKMLDPRKGRGLFNTYNAKLWPFRWPLDHVFVTKEFKVTSIKRLPYYGSDHYPIYIGLSL